MLATAPHQAPLRSRSQSRILTRFVLLALVMTLSMTSRVVARTSVLVHAAAVGDGMGVLTLSLDAAVYKALALNPALRVSRLDPLQQSANVESETGVLDHTLALTLERRQNTLPSATLFDPTGRSFNDTRQMVLGLSRTLPTGTEVGVDLDVTRVLTNSRLRLFNPSFTSAARVRFAHPLQRGQGRKFQLARIQVARQNEKISWANLERAVLDTLVDVEEAYWELAFRHRDLEVKQLLLKQAQDLVDSNRLRFEIGDLDRLGILEAEAAATAREEDVLQARNAVKDQSDRLSELLGLLRRQPRAPESILPTDEPTVPAEPLPGLDEASRLALEHRPERRAALYTIASRGYEVAEAKSNKKPRADVVGDFGFNGLTRGFGTSLGQIDDADFSGYSVGVVVEVPLENREARGEHRRRSLAQEQAVRDLARVETTLVREAREASRQVETDIQRVEATQRAERTSMATLEGEHERFQQGLLRSWELLRFQESLALVRSREARALADLRISIAKLHRATGRLLERRNVEFDPESKMWRN